MIVTVGPSGKEQVVQSLLPMKVEEGEGTGRWEETGLSSILPTYTEPPLCARAVPGTGEERQIRLSALPERSRGTPVSVSGISTLQMDGGAITRPWRV